MQFRSGGTNLTYLGLGRFPGLPTASELVAWGMMSG